MCANIAARPFGSSSGVSPHSALRSAATVSSSQPRGPGGALREVDAALQLAPDQKCSAERLLELVPHLLRLALVLDTVAWGVWKQKMAPAAGSSLRPQAPLQRIFKDFLAAPESDAKPTSAAAHAEIDRLRELVRAMLSGVAQCGPEVACRVMQGISPADIESEVGTGGLRNRDADYWRAYKGRAERLDAAALEREVTGVLARFVDKWMRNAEAKPRAS